MSKNCCFPKSSRLRKPSEFQKVYQQNQIRISGQYFIMLTCSHTGVAKAGFVVSKKVSKKAVIRNRIKRIAREYYRHTELDDNFHYVIIAKPSAAIIESELLMLDLTNCFSKTLQKCKKLLLV